MPGAQKRLAELDSVMAQDDFWNNRETAQKAIDEANSLRKKVDPLVAAEKQLDDFRVLIELGEAEPPAAQPPILAEVTRDLEKFIRDLGSDPDAARRVLAIHDRDICLAFAADARQMLRDRLAARSSHHVANHQQSHAVRSLPALRQIRHHVWNRRSRVAIGYPSRLRACAPASPTRVELSRRLDSSLVLID